MVIKSTIDDERGKKKRNRTAEMVSKRGWKNHTSQEKELLVSDTKNKNQLDNKFLMKLFIA